MKVLLLGGTADARAVAELLSAAGHEPVTSVAGRTAQARESDAARVGGFGGVAGLTGYLRATDVAAVIDATHPFAAQMTRNAAAACAATGVPLLRFSRPGWANHPHAAQWVWVPSHAAAAEVAARAPGRVLLTVGRQPLPAYQAVGDVLARVAEWPGGPVPTGWRVLAARGPFELAAELDLLQSEQITTLVSKDSGGDQTAAKLDACAQLGVQVIMVARPPAPAGVSVVSEPAAVLGWLALQ